MPVVKDPKHLARIRRLPCFIHLLQGTRTLGSEAAHIRYEAPEHGKRQTGMGEKPDDRFVVPLCHLCHREGPGAQHSMNERAYWEAKRIDPVALALALYAAPDEAGLQAVLRQAIKDFFR